MNFNWQDLINDFEYERNKPAGFRFLFNIQDYFNEITKQQEKEEQRIKSGYYLTAPFNERMNYMIRYWNVAQSEKENIINLLNEIDKLPKNIGNTPEVNDLLEKLGVELKKLGQLK